MQIGFHLGAHATDDERLIRTLANAPEALDTAGTHTPVPRAYRNALRDALIALKGRPADAATQQALLEAAARGARGEIRRLVFSYENFLALPESAITEKGFYPAAAEKLGPLAHLFPGAQVEFFLALRNPALLLSALAARQPGRSIEEILAGQAPESLRWGPVVARMAQAAQAAGAARLILWCHEDLPLVLPEVARAMGGLAEEVALPEEDRLLAEIMTAEGMARLRGYLAQHPPKTVEQRRKVLAAFLDKFARPEQLEEEVTLPGWDADLVARMTADYEADVLEIAALEGVTFIAP